MNQVLQRVLAALREWPLFLAAVAVVSLLWLPAYLPTRTNLLIRDRARLEVAGRFARIGSLDVARAILQSFEAVRPESPYVPIATLLRGEVVLRESRAGRYPGEGPMTGAKADLLQAERDALVQLLPQTQYVERLAAFERVELPAGMPREPVERAFALIEAIPDPSRSLAEELRVLDALARCVRRVPDLRRSLAWAYQSHHRPDLAEQELLPLLTPEKPDLFLDRAYALADAARMELPDYTLDAALEQVDQYMRYAAPEEWILGVEQRARILFMHAHPDRVLDLVDPFVAQAVDPTVRARLLLLRGVAYKGLGRFEAAAQDLTAAFEGLETLPEERVLAQFHMAEVMRLVGDRACITRYELLIGRGRDLTAMANLGLGRHHLAQDEPEIPPLPLIRTGLSEIEGAHTLDRFSFDGRRFVDELEAAAEDEGDPDRLILFAEVLQEWLRLNPMTGDLYQRASTFYTRAARILSRRRIAEERQGRMDKARELQEHATAAYASAARQHIAWLDLRAALLTPEETLLERRRAGDRFFEGRLYRAAYEQYQTGATLVGVEGVEQAQFLAALALSRAGIYRTDDPEMPGASPLFAAYLRDAMPSDELIPNALLELARIQAEFGEFADAIESLRRMRDPQYDLRPRESDQLENLLRGGFADQPDAPGVLVEYESDRPPRERHLWALMNLDTGRAGLAMALSLRSAPDGEPAEAAESRENRRQWALAEGLERLEDFLAREIPDPAADETALPEAVPALLTLARIRVERDEWPQAVEPLQRALRVAQARQADLSAGERADWRQAFLLLGEVHEFLGDFRGAHDAYERMIRRFSGNADVMWALAGRTRASLALAPPPEPGASAARAFERRRRLREAIQSIQRMEELLVESPAAFADHFGGRGEEGWRGQIRVLRAMLPPDARELEAAG